MIANDSIAQARINLHDETVASYRWTNQELLDYLNDGIRDLRSRRPDLIIGSDLEITSFASLPLGGGGALPTTVIYIDDLMRNALASYISFRALSRDTEDEGNVKRAADFLNQYTREIS